jgi:hypothetical protein
VTPRIDLMQLAPDIRSRRIRSFAPAVPSLLLLIATQ